MCDAVGIGGFLVDHVTLHRSCRVDPFAREFGITACAQVELGMVRVPVVGHEGRFTIGYSDMYQGIVQLLPGLDRVAQLFQGFHDQQGLKALFGQCAFQGLHGHALPW